MGRISLIDTPESISIVPFTKSAAKFHRVYIISTFKRSLLKQNYIDWTNNPSWWICYITLKYVKQIRLKRS